MKVDNNRISLLHGDCIQEMDKLEPGSIDLIITDPPYNLANFMKDRQTNLVKMRDNFFGAKDWDVFDPESWHSSMDAFFNQARRVLKPKGSMVMFMSLLRIETIVSLAEKHKFYYKTTGVWHKTNPMPRNMNLHFVNSIEGWVYFINKGKTGTFNNNGKAIHDFIESSITSSKEKQFGAHPTQKPENVFKHFVEILSNENDTVLDPFMGSGTAGVVSKQLGRKFIGIEITDEYYDVAQKRIANVQEDLLQLLSNKKTMESF